RASGISRSPLRFFFIWSFLKVGNASRASHPTHPPRLGVATVRYTRTAARLPQLSDPRFVQRGLNLFFLGAFRLGQAVLATPAFAASANEPLDGLDGSESSATDQHGLELDALDAALPPPDQGADVGTARDNFRSLAQRMELLILQINHLCLTG